MTLSGVAFYGFFLKFDTQWDAKRQAEDEEDTAELAVMGDKDRD